MKKIVYAIALLGALPLFQSCIDDSESLSVKEVREAKAEELQSLAALNEANAQAQAALAAAQVRLIDSEAALNAANSELIQAQAALLAVEAELKAVEVQIANTKLEQEKIELEKKKVELQVAQSNLEKTIAENNRIIEEEKNNLAKVQKQLEIDLQNLANELLAAQILALENQMKYNQLLIESELSEAQATQMKINAYLIAFQNAAMKLYQQQAATFEFETQLTLAESNLLSAQEIWQNDIKAATDKKAMDQQQIAEFTAILKTYQLYADYTPDQLHEAQGNAYIDLVKAQQNLYKANNNLTAAQEAQSEAEENLAWSTFRQKGLNIFLRNWEIRDIATVTDVENNIDTVYYGFTYYVPADEGITTDQGNGKWVSDTLFYEVTQNLVYEMPSATGVESKYQAPYEQILAYYSIYGDGTGIENFIQYIADQDEQNNDVTYLEEDIESTKGFLNDAEVAFTKAKAVYEEAAQVWEPMEEKAEELYDAAYPETTNEGLEARQLKDVEDHYEKLYNFATSSVEEYEGYVENYTPVVEGYETQLEDLNKQLAAATTKDEKDDIQKQIDSVTESYDYWNNLLTAAATDLKDAEDAQKAYKEKWDDAKEAREAYEEEHSLEAAEQAYIAYVSTFAYKNAQYAFNEAENHLRAYENSYYTYKNQLAELEQNLKNAQQQASNDSAVYADAYKVIKAEATNVASLVKALNTANLNEAMAWAEQQQYSADETAAQSALQTINGLITGEQSPYWNIDRLENMIAELEADIEAQDEIINSKFDSSKYDYYIAMYKEYVADSKAILAIYQAAYDAAKANLEAAYAEAGTSK